MRENCTPGTARGVPGNRHSYRGATITRTVVIWDWPRTRHTNDLSRHDHQVRQRSWRCRAWAACTIATSGARRLETALSLWGFIPLRMKKDEPVCPAKAGMFSGSESHRGKSQRLVA